MHIREYQTWLEEWDKARTWDRVLPSHTLLHAIEEIGEISRHIQVLEGYRSPDGVSIEQIRAELALELSDLQVMIFKIAYLCGIDMESAMILGQQKADRRFPDPAAGLDERRDYWERFRRYLRDANLDDPA
jgi:NTP pyrophosphatase (non-canonical NTP hydrolase)